VMEFPIALIWRAAQGWPYFVDRFDMYSLCDMW
jgi:hypothetical protein